MGILKHIFNYFFKKLIQIINIFEFLIFNFSVFGYFKTYFLNFFEILTKKIINILEYNHNSFE
jgi:hypothetical protein